MAECAAHVSLPSQRLVNAFYRLDCHVLLKQLQNLSGTWQAAIGVVDAASRPDPRQTYRAVHARPKQSLPPIPSPPKTPARCSVDGPTRRSPQTQAAECPLVHLLADHTQALVLLIAHSHHPQPLPGTPQLAALALALARASALALAPAPAPALQALRLVSSTVRPLRAPARGMLSRRQPQLVDTPALDLA